MRKKKEQESAEAISGLKILQQISGKNWTKIYIIYKYIVSFHSQNVWQSIIGTFKSYYVHKQ